MKHYSIIGPWVVLLTVENEIADLCLSMAAIAASQTAASAAFICNGKRENAISGFVLCREQETPK
jgi:hypothetical protein